MPKAPSFIEFKKFQLSLKDQTHLQLTGFAVYNNPNPFGALLSRTEIQILIENAVVSKIDQTESIEIPAASDFDVPIDILLDLNLLSKDNRNVFDQAFKQILGNNLEVHYMGNIYFNLLGKEIAVPVDYKEKISVGLNFQESN